MSTYFKIKQYAAKVTEYALPVCRVGFAVALKSSLMQRILLFMVCTPHTVYSLRLLPFREYQSIHGSRAGFSPHSDNLVCGI